MYQMASNDWLKMTVHDASAMNRHNGKYQRENGKHENENINPELSHLNLYIGCNDYSEAYYNMRARVKEIDTAHLPKRKNKSDTRIICAMIEVPCPQEIYSQGYEKAQQFFYDVYEIYKNFFGKENVHGGFVHFDEVHDYTYKDGTVRTSLPHMHTLVSAYVEWHEKDKQSGEMVERKGINGKNFETKARMKKLNQLVEDYCLENFGVRFMTGETPQKKSVERLKAEEKVHQLTGQKKQIQTELNELEVQRKTIHQDIEELTSKKNEMLHRIDEQSAQLTTLEKEVVSHQTEIDSLKKKISELQQQILSITLPERPVYPTKPSKPRPQQKTREDYAKFIMEDYAGTLKLIERIKEKNRLCEEYDKRVDEWNKYDEAVKEYDTVLYPQWANSTETVKVLQEQLRSVNSQQSAIEKGQRTIYFGEELKMKKQIKELEKQKDELQSQLDLIRSQIQNFAEQEYQRKRKADAETIAYYQQYCGISPDKIKSVVIEQEQQEQESLSHQDYDSV